MTPYRSLNSAFRARQGLLALGLVLAALGCWALVARRPPLGHDASRDGSGQVPPGPRTSGAVTHGAGPSEETFSVRSQFSVADNDDPRRDGWETEALNLAVSAQLKRLAEVLRDGPALRAESLRPLVTDDISIVWPRSDKLQEVHREATLVVRRGPNAGAGDAPSARSTARAAPDDGAEAARSALGALWAENAPRGAVQSHWKVVRVEPSPPELATDLIGEVAFSTSSGRVGLHLRARATWLIGGPDAHPQLRSLAVGELEEVSWLQAKGPWFVDDAAAVLGHHASYWAQLAHGQNYWVSRVQRQLGMSFGMQTGLAVGDANGDGLDDLYVCQPGGLPNRLYVMRADGRADDLSAAAGLDWLMPTAAAQFADLDNDGDQDLLLVAVDRSGIWCLRNDGRTHFEVVTQLEGPQSPTSLALADYDSDGNLDLYVCNYQDGGILAITGTTRPVPFHDATNGGPNVLYRNEGNWQFRDVTAEVGLDEHNYRWSYAASWDDFDRDGDLDLYVANDFGRNNLYRNESGRFRDVAAEAGVEDVASSMSVAWGDYNQDGWNDLYVGNMWSSAGHRVVFQPRFHQELPSDTRELFQRHAVGNSLFLNQGDGTFRETSDEAGVREGRWAWSSNFVDLNNDGREDLLVANGFLTHGLEHDL